MVTLHQRRPSYVVECEGAHLALDDALAQAVNVWATDQTRDVEAGGQAGGGPRRAHGGSAAHRRHGWRRA
jgi:hypothetical protein